MSLVDYSSSDDDDSDNRDVGDQVATRWATEEAQTSSVVTSSKLFSRLPMPKLIAKPKNSYSSSSVSKSTSTNSIEKSGTTIIVPSSLSSSANSSAKTSRRTSKQSSPSCPPKSVFSSIPPPKHSRNILAAPNSATSNTHSLGKRKNPSSSSCVSSFPVPSSQNDILHNTVIPNDSYARKQTKSHHSTFKPEEILQLRESNVGSDFIPADLSDVHVVDVNGSDLVEKDWQPTFLPQDVRKEDIKIKARFWNSREGTAQSTSAPSRVHRRKNQINQLAFQATAEKMRLDIARSQGRANRQAASNRYGW